VSTRTYERIGPDDTQTVFVHIDDNGYVRMTADNLHNLLTHIGFAETKEKADA
jgi:HSP90 family molecular chaperone